MNESRKAIVRAAYDKLDVNKDGKVTVQDLAVLHVKGQPDSRRHTEQELYDFIDQWDTKQKDGIVTFDEFLEFYEGISCLFDSDDHFAQMMKHAMA